MNDPHIHPQSWQDLRRLIALHGHEKLILALRYDQMAQILGEECPAMAAAAAKKGNAAIDAEIESRVHPIGKNTQCITA